VELLELVHKQCKADEAQRVGIGRNVDLVRREYTALRGAQDVRRAIEQNEIVVRLEHRDLLAEHQVRGPLRVARKLSLEVDKVECRGDEVQARKKLLARLALHHILDHEVLDMGLARVENRVDRAVPCRIDLVPALEL
jgi:hypothetical protein